MELILIFGGIAWVALMVYLLLYSVKNMAEKNFCFTHVPSGEIVFVVAGKNLVHPISNVEGWHVDPTTGCVATGSEPSKPLRRWLGIDWIGIYPFRQLHWYEFSWTSWEDITDAAGNVTARIMKARKEPVRSMYFEYTYPIKVDAAELSDGKKIDLNLNVTVRAFNVYTAVFKLKGDWFVPFAKAVSGAVADYVRRFDFEGFQKEDKEGPTSELAKTIIAINGPKVAGGAGIADSLGVTVEAVHYEKFEITPDARQAEIEAATQAAKLEEEKGKGVISAAKAQAKATKLLGSAKASAIRDQMKAAGGDSSVLNTAAMSEAIAHFGDKGAQTLVVDPSKIVVPTK